MKKINLSILHLLIVIVTFMFTFAKGQDSYSRRYETPILLSEHNQSTDRPEIIAYQLVPGRDNYCHFEIQIVEGFGWNDIPDYQREETKEIIIEMVYQMGESGVSKFKKMWKALKQNPKDYYEAAKQMMDSRWAKQTYNRARNLSDEMRLLSHAT